MSKHFYDNQTPIYRNEDLTKSITIDTSNNKFVISDTSISKSLIINSEEFSDGTNAIPYSQIYENINSVEACVFPAPNSTTLKINDTIILDNSFNSVGVLNVSGENMLIYSSTGDVAIQTKNTSTDSTHYLSFVDTTTSSPTVIKKSSGITCNPNTNSISAAGTISGGLISGPIKLTNDNNNINCYVTFAKNSGDGELFIDSSATPLTYNPSTSTLSCNNFSGNSSTATNSTTANTANSVNTTNTDTNANYYLTLTDSVAGSSKTLYVDSSATPLTYNPSTSTLSCTNFSGNAATATTANSINTTNTDLSSNYYITLTDSVAGSNKTLYVDSSNNPLTYNPLTSALTCDYTVLSKGIVNTNDTKNYFWTDRTSIPTGGNNIAIGWNAANSITTSIENIIIGTESGKQLNTGRQNVYVGHQTSKTSDSSNCVSIGYKANIGNTHGNNCTAIGSGTNCVTYNNCTAIGAGATNTSANQIRLGTETETVSCPGSLTFKMTSDNNSGTYYIPFSKVAGGTEGALFVDDVTGPLTYNPGNSTLTATTFVGTAFQPSNASTAVSFAGNVATQPITIGGALSNSQLNLANGTTMNGGTVNIMSANFGNTNGGTINMVNGNYTATNGAIIRIMSGIFTTSGTINILDNNHTGTGTLNICTSTTANNSINIGAITTYAKQIRTSTTNAPSNARDLGYTVNQATTGWTTSLTSNTQTNITSVSFTSVDYGTYLFEAKIQITPTDNTVSRQQIIGISTASGNYGNNTDLQYTMANVGNPMLSVMRVLNIYANTTVYLVGYIDGTNGTVVTTSSAGIFSYTRIA
jgi:hypothetical protein